MRCELVMRSCEQRVVMQIISAEVDKSHEFKHLTIMVVWVFVLLVES